MKNETEKFELKVQLRTELGKKVKQLRKKGIIPANISGGDNKPTSVSVNLKEFSSIHKAAGETGIIYIEVEGKTVPTLIKEVTYQPVDGSLLHIDFRQINLKQKITTDVPIQVEGESIAVEQLGGVMLTQADKLDVEALPANIPSHILIDISKITELGQDIKVSDLPTSPDYVIKEDPEKVIISVVEHKEESTEVQSDKVETEITSAKEGEEGEAEGAASDAKSAPAEESKEDKK
ncbi:MAG: 50S ribosomal protein L25 [Patescibacteria group bacterium]